MKEALSSSETSVLTRATRRNIPEDTILHLIYYISQKFNILSSNSLWSRDSSFRYRDDHCWTNEQEIFLVPILCRLYMGPPQPAIQWVSQVPFPGIKRQGREVDRSSLSSIKVNKTSIYTSTSLHTSSWRGSSLVKHRKNFSLASITTNSVAFSPQVNYTDWATATFWRNVAPNFADRGESRGQRGVSPTVVNLSFLDRSRYFSFKQLLIYPQKGRVDPVPDPLLLRKFSSARNRTRNLWVFSQEVWPLNHRGGLLLQ
jgi:hypothetical protein